jgi:hypothetical protein
MENSLKFIFSQIHKSTLFALVYRFSLFSQIEKVDFIFLNGKTHLYMRYRIQREKSKLKEG